MGRPKLQLIPIEAKASLRPSKRYRLTTHLYLRFRHLASQLHLKKTLLLKALDRPKTQNGYSFHNY